MNKYPTKISIKLQRTGKIQQTKKIVQKCIISMTTLFLRLCSFHQFNNKTFAERLSSKYHLMHPYLNKSVKKVWSKTASLVLTYVLETLNAF